MCKRLLVLALVAMLSPVALGETVFVDDHFDDGGIGTNTTGIGTGFNAGTWSGGSAVTESGTTVTLENGEVGWSRAAITSKEGAPMGADIARFEFRGVSFINNPAGWDWGGSTDRLALGVKATDVAEEIDAGGVWQGFWIQFESDGLTEEDHSAAWNGISTLFYSDGSVRTKLASWSFDTLNWDNWANLSTTANFTPVLDITLDLSPVGYSLTIVGDTITLLSGSLSNTYAAAGITNELTTGYAFGFAQTENPSLFTSVDQIIIKVVNPALASLPSPADEATDVCRDVVLSWTPGKYAPLTNGHKVFFSEDFNDVNDGIGGIVQSPNSYDPPGLLDLGTTYYWRIDEADTTTGGWAEGDIWQFTTEPIAYPIENITATASSSRTVDQGPEKTIGGLGSGLDAKDLHSTTETDMWLSADSEPGQAWIMFQFDKDYDKLYQMWVWNHNTLSEEDLGRGLKEVTIECSLTGAEGDWAQLTGVPDFNQAPGLYDGVSEYAHNTIIDFGGMAAEYVKITAESNWGGLKKYGLSEVRFFYIPVLARKPSPGNGTPNVSPDVILTWRSGRDATEHKVYFSSSEQAVTEGTITPESVPGNECEASYNPGGDLDLSTTYYWRIDEVDGDQTWQGDVWSFTTSDYLVVDDMESYGDANTPGPPPPSGSRIWYTWNDGSGWTQPVPGKQGNGTGSIVDPNTGIVNGGSRSLRLTFYNDGSTGKKYYSEITADTSNLAIGQDWTKTGVKSLSLWFYGNASNSADPFYIAVKDNVKTVKVNYSDPNELLEPKWHEWPIDLSKLGISLTNVTMLSIGLGKENNTSPGGTGVIYIDDIRLYPSRCVASIINLDADLNSDCVVDYQDVGVLADQWLDSGLLITPVPLGNTNLVGWWKFDDGSGTTATDSSVSGNNGSLLGDLVWADGYDGGALRFDGIDDYVELQIGSLIGSLTKSTFATWANFSNAGGSWQRIFDFGNDTNIYMFLTPRIGTTGVMHFAITTSSNAGESQIDAPSTLASGWHHVAVTIGDPNTAGFRTLRLYLDGAQVGVNTQSTLSPSSLGATANNWLGRSQWANDAYYTGRLDDFRIYNRNLSAGEVGSLAGKTQPFSEAYDLNVDGSINFKDFAKLAQGWLEEVLWPQP